MNILEMVLNAQNGGAVSQLGRQFGLSEDQVKSAIGQLVPALSGGLQRNVTESNGLDSLRAALQGGRHARYVEDPRSLEDPDTVADGNAILGHILGSKDVSRQLAARAAANTGIDSSLLKSMLPMVAAMVMGSLNKQTEVGTTQGGSGGAMDMLSSFLDADKDGSVMDDLLGMASKFLR